MEVINAIGRRKAAVARIYLREGKGDITINQRELENYFPAATLQYIVKHTLPEQAQLDVKQLFEL